MSMLKMSFASMSNLLELSAMLIDDVNHLMSQKIYLTFCSANALM
jgi:hypothetical protein